MPTFILLAIVFFVAVPFGIWSAIRWPLADWRNTILLVCGIVLVAGPLLYVDELGEGFEITYDGILRLLTFGTGVALLVQSVMGLIRARRSNDGEATI